MLVKYTVYPHCLNLIHWMSKRNMPELLTEILVKEKETRYLATMYSPLLLATTRCANALSHYLVHPDRADILKEMPLETIIKCIMMPDSSCVPFFSKLAPENDHLTTSMQNFDKTPIKEKFRFWKFAYSGLFHWVEDTGVSELERIFKEVPSLDTLVFDNPDRKEAQKTLFPRSLEKDKNTTNVIRTTMFKIPILKGYKDSIDFHEALAASVITKDSIGIFGTISIKGIIEYKFEKHQNLLWFLLAFQISYVILIYYFNEYIQRHPYVIGIYAVIKTCMLVLQAAPWNPRSFLVWLYFLWPLFCDVPSMVNSIWYLYDFKYNQR